ncbi:MAG: hypothetical protein IJZ81_02885 [Clostridia bacterium]|nr:hypothetical protein [Clostridia bacterium]
MKSKKSLIAIFIIIVLAFSSFCVSAEEKVLTTLSTSGDLRVMFQFDKEEPSITFISPSNERLSKGHKRLKNSSGNGWCTYLIENAQAGQWKMEYDKKSNSTVSYNIIESIENIALQYFKFEKMQDTFAKVSFRADYTPGGTYSYEIFLLGEGANENSRTNTIKSGSAICGEDVKTEVNLHSYSSGQYKLGLYVSMDNERLFDQAYTDVFSYTNPNSPKELSDFEVHLNKRASHITLNWENAENLSGSSYLVKVKNKKGEEIYSNEVDTLTDKFAFLPEDKELSISLYQKIGGIFSNPNTKKVKLNSKHSVKILSEEVTNSSVGQIECKTNSKATVHLEMAAEKELLQKRDENPDEVVIKDIDIKKNALIDYNLTNTTNYIFVSMLASDGIYYEDALDIYFDYSAPYITLYEDIGKINVDTSKFVLIGETNIGSVFKINDKEYPLDENGGFTAELKLKLGKNVFKITSQDKSGNISERTVIIKRVNKALLGIPNNGFTGIIIGLIISAVIIAISVIFIKRRKAGKKK